MILIRFIENKVAFMADFEKKYSYVVDLFIQISQKHKVL